MKIIVLKCPSCGASLKVSDSLKSFTCNFCGTTTLLDDEIIRVEHTIKNLDKDEIYKKIDGYIKIDYLDEAKDTIDELIKKRAFDSRTWLYAIKVYTNNYSENEWFDYDQIMEYLEKYELLEEDENEKNKNISFIKNYIKKLEDKIDNNIDEDAMICPYCSEKIRYGQKNCESCNSELYWPKI